MSSENDIFSNRSYLKEINANFIDLIDSIQSNYETLPLCSEESSEITEISFGYLQEFNGSNQTQQIILLSMIKDFNKLCIFLSSNPTSYDCQSFVEELYQLANNSLIIIQHMAFHCEDILFTLCVSYDDNLRFVSLKLISLLMNDNQPVAKERILHLNRLCYESLYDFDVYYDQIKALTIESKIIYLTKAELHDLINKQFIRKDLEDKIVEAIHQLGGYVFIKMHRSPKDAYDAIAKEIDGEWSRFWNFKSDEQPHSYFMKIENLHQLKLLFKSSDRLREDCQQISSHGKLILRKWIDHLPNEYRCFVCNKNLNAISTYSHNQHVTANDKQLKTFINSKDFKNTILKIPYNHAVVDCSIDPITYQVIIIEINPFSKRSSAGQFSWIIDRDILYHHYESNQSVCIK